MNDVFVNLKSGIWNGLLCMLGCVTFCACSITKHVPEGEYLLNSERITIKGEGIKEDDLRSFIRQHPNSTIARMRFNLWLYNFNNLNKDRRIDRKLRELGEAPVIFDSIQSNISVTRLGEYIDFRGFFNGSKIEVQVKKRKKKANVHYYITLAQPYTIRNIDYNIRDSLLDKGLIADSTKALLGKGNVFDGIVLEKETDRVARELRSRGYYQFNKNYVTFTADTSVGNREVDVTMVVQQELVEPLSDTRRPHRLFVVDRLVLNTDFDPLKAVEDTHYFQGWDTISAHGLQQIYKDRPGLHPNISAIYNTIESGKLYDEQDVVRTSSNFSNLRLFKSINIRFAELPKPVDDTALNSPEHLVGNIILSPLKLQSYNVGGEVSVSGNKLWGATAYLNYQHKNLFHGAEIFDASVSATFQKVQWRSDAAPENSIEMGAKVSINVPQFSIPLNLDLYKNLNSPRTMLAMSGSYQQRPDYTRWLSTASFGYSWQNLGNMTYIFNPIDINLINVEKTAETAFFDIFKDNPYLISAYQNTFLLGSMFSAIYNTKSMQSKDYLRLRVDTELKGNILSAAYHLSKATPINDEAGNYYQILDTRFAQFVKFDLNFTYQKATSDITSVALRTILGLGFAYGNSLSLPFDKMYYAGGAYSLRGWQVRAVGPGTYSNKDPYIINRVANMRAEFNVEYRFKLAGMLEGAAFFDAGNIWSTYKADNRSGSQFSFSNLHQQIAMDWGLGLRLVWSVLVLRADYGIQLHDPTQSSPYFILPRQWFSAEHTALIIALGYPF